MTLAVTLPHASPLPQPPQQPVFTKAAPPLDASAPRSPALVSVASSTDASSESDSGSVARRSSVGSAASTVSASATPVPADDAQMPPTEVTTPHTEESEAGSSKEEEEEESDAEGERDRVRARSSAMSDVSGRSAQVHSSLYTRYSSTHTASDMVRGDDEDALFVPRKKKRRLTEKQITRLLAARDNDGLTGKKLHMAQRIELGDAIGLPEVVVRNYLNNHKRKRNTRESLAAARAEAAAAAGIPKSARGRVRVRARASLAHRTMEMPLASVTLRSSSVEDENRHSSTGSVFGSYVPVCGSPTSGHMHPLLHYQFMSSASPSSGAHSSSQSSPDHLSSTLQHFFLSSSAPHPTTYVPAIQSLPPSLVLSGSSSSHHSLLDHHDSHHNGFALTSDPASGGSVLAAPATSSAATFDPFFDPAPVFRIREHMAATAAHSNHTTNHHHTSVSGAHADDPARDFLSIPAPARATSTSEAPALRQPPFGGSASLLSHTAGETGVGAMDESTTSPFSSSSFSSSSMLSSDSSDILSSCPTDPSAHEVEHMRMQIQFLQQQLMDTCNKQHQNVQMHRARDHAPQSQQQQAPHAIERSCSPHVVFSASGCASGSDSVDHLLSAEALADAPATAAQRACAKAEMQFDMSGELDLFAQLDRVQQQQAYLQQQQRQIEESYRLLQQQQEQQQHHLQQRQQQHNAAQMRHVAATTNTFDFLNPPTQASY